ncbi:hypothetical protein LTR78_006719 [Recurvomyces mirabilis]|uniref:C2H2-type domain-containing protein n=1 Tax=Recurvomyces mirabilis TaxID=574656 RepID=A0AAE0WKP6_9PEZI|nr:hypothetical protein LTR78_006719 [Recurvomyces mirabilis]KAK5151392.1 hypothetical protein LTS14_009235 [Recurvomyces mirabilis]
MSQEWNQASFADEVYTTSYVPTDPVYQPETSQDFQGPIYAHAAPCTSAYVTFAPSQWLQTPQESVVQGLSPVLSQESQSSHTFTSLSEPDPSLLPPSLDTSYPVDPSWSTYSSETYHGHMLPAGSVPYESYPVYGPSMPAPHSALSEGSRSFVPGHAPQYFQPRHAVPYSVMQRRPLLPRTHSTAVPSQPVFGYQRILRPHVTMPQNAHAFMPTVSNVPHEVRPTTSALLDVPVSMPAPAVATNVPGSPFGVLPARSMETVRPELAVQTQPIGPVGYWVDHTEDWSSSVRTDLDMHRSPMLTYRSDSSARRFKLCNTDVSASTSQSYATVQPPLVVSPRAVKPLVAKLDRIPRMDEQSAQTSRASTGPASDSEEGRHRTHVLYSKEAEADGLYHCPFKDDPTCQHQPTKLKCNYDKFIDSHIKPFRCKNDGCAKQEFSSTACLLRHEREAHGMHGHGDRPHLCYYTGCERGMPGNGFPRRYNLFDHMKRVHDHKEDIHAMDGSSAVVGSSKRAGGRKRKASVPAADEPVAQRQMSQLPPVQIPVAQTVQMPYPAYPQATMVPYPQEVYSAPAEPRKGHHQRQRVLYTQWANQRDMVARQMDFVQSPDDEAGLQQLSHNIAELRRLSQDAKRG